MGAHVSIDYGVAIEVVATCIFSGAFSVLHNFFNAIYITQFWFLETKACGCPFYY